MSGFGAGEVVQVQIRHGSVYDNLDQVTMNAAGGGFIYFTVPAWATGKQITSTGTTNSATTNLTVTPPTGQLGSPNGDTDQDPTGHADIAGIGYPDTDDRANRNA